MPGRIDLVPTLNIKDPEVYRLAKELAERRHTSMTGVVRQALERALETERRASSDRVRRMMEIAERSAARPEPFLTDDDLYDEMGLPK